MSAIYIVGEIECSKGMEKDQVLEEKSDEKKEKRNKKKKIF
jgi:hypothetical protein